MSVVSFLCLINVLMLVWLCNLLYELKCNIPFGHRLERWKCKDTAFDEACFLFTAPFMVLGVAAQIICKLYSLTFITFIAKEGGRR